MLTPTSALPNLRASPILTRRAACSAPMLMTMVPTGHSMSIPLNFGLAVLGGLGANICLMRLNSMDKGCTNVCTLFQFVYGMFDSLSSPAKRKYLVDSSTRRLTLTQHALFSAMFFCGPYLGNMACNITNNDFYPVFLVVRSCGSVTSMLLGYLFAHRRYSLAQVLSVLVITAGAGLTTLGCYSGSQAAALGKSAATNTGVVVPGSDPTPPHVFLVGLALLVGNLLNDSGKDVLQARVFAPHLQAEKKAKAEGKPYGASVTDEAMVFMSVVGTALMAIIAGPEVFQFVSRWAAHPTWRSLPLPVAAGAALRLALPLEASLVTVNFVGNWNAKKICTWLNAHSTAVVSSLVPMFYRLISTVISTRFFSGVAVPPYTWAGVALVFGGSLTYLLSPKLPPADEPKAKAA